MGLGSGRPDFSESHALAVRPILLSLLTYRFLLQTAPNNVDAQGLLSQALFRENTTQDN